MARDVSCASLRRLAMASAPASTAHWRIFCPCQSRASSSRLLPSLTRAVLNWALFSRPRTVVVEYFVVGDGAAISPTRSSRALLSSFTTMRKSLLQMRAAPSFVISGPDRSRFSSSRSLLMFSAARIVAFHRALKSSLRSNSPGPDEYGSLLAILLSELERSSPSIVARSSSEPFSSCDACPQTIARR
eukprot:2236534-Prymnesium_polylepis.3